MNKRDKLELWLFVLVALATSCSLVASMAHLLEAFGWVNNSFMAWALAVVTVLMNAAFVILGSTSHEKDVRWAVIAGMFLLFVVEYAGNFTVGGLLAYQYLPQEVSTLYFGVDRQVVIWAAASLFAAFLPLLNFISIYATSRAGLRLIAKASRPIEPNQWAEMVLQMHQKAQDDKDKVAQAD